MSYRINYQKDLNEKQFEAVMHHEGPCLVIAGAGTGKTTTLVYRVARLIEDGVKPESILFLTFTRKAADNMTERCSSMLNQSCQNINANTFHGFTLGELKRYSNHIGYKRDFTLIDPDDVSDVMDIVKEEQNISSLPYKFPNNSTLLSIQSRAITKLVTVQGIIAAFYPKFIDYSWDIERILKRFQEFKKEKNIMDFDDLLKNFLELITNNETVWNWIRQRYQFIMIDEYQDTDRIQAAMMRHLAGQSGNIMAVGDDAQSIYAFRGADVKNIMSFQNEYENCRFIKIERNYRSTRQILGLANAVMSNAAESFKKELFTDKTGEHGPLLYRVRDNHHESLCIAGMISEYLRLGGNLKDVAVLSRNGRFTDNMEMELNRRGLPYKKFGGMELGKRAHIKDMLAFMRIGVNTEDVLSWHRVFKLFPGVGEKKAAKFTKQIVNEGKNLPYLRELGYSELYNLIMNLRSTSRDPGGQLERIAQFYKPIFEKKNHNKKAWQDMETLITSASHHNSTESFLDAFVLNSIDNKQEIEKGEYITLSTIHSAKGLEWNLVFIVCVNDECMPYLPGGDSEQHRRDEEVRLFHVALTRAKDHLFLFAPKRQVYNRKSCGLVSPFLTAEIISEHLEIIDLDPPELLDIPVAVQSVQGCGSFIIQELP